MRAERGARGWLKRPGPGRAFEQERRALVAWRCEGMPRLLEADEGEGTLLIEHLPGRSPEPGDLQVWRAAGAFRRRFAQPCEGDPLPLDQALRLRLQSWSGRLGLPPVALSGDHRGLRRVRCHRDFQPRNWLWNGAALGVIDFEHAAPDHPLADLVKLLDHVAISDPRFLAVAGPLDESALARLRDLRLLHGLASLAWGLRHGDEVFARLGRAVLREVRFPIGL